MILITELMLMPEHINILNIKQEYTSLKWQNI